MKKSILVVDDDDTLRKTMSRLFEKKGFTVNTAGTGREGLNKIREMFYDLIILDIRMPEMDGIEVLEKIMELKPETTVVMISGHGNIETAVEAIKKGAFDFIVKPLDLNRLLITIRNAGDKTVLIKETKVLKQKINKRRYYLIILYHS